METCTRCQNKIRITKKNNWDWESRGFLCEICLKIEEINEDEYKKENVLDKINIIKGVFC